MPMQPQSAPQQSNAPVFNPQMPPQMQAKAGVTPPAPQQATPSVNPEEGGEGGNDVIKGLEDHLNTITDPQKKFLADALRTQPEITIGVLGIVNGQEVMDYFSNLYQQYFGKGAQTAPAQPNSAAQQPNPGPQMAPSSAPAQQPVMSSPQAKATPMPMG